MFPLIYAKENDEVIIKKIISNNKKRLEELGFVKDTIITIISKNQNGFIIKIRETKIAISENIAVSIYVDMYINEPCKVK